VRAFLGSASIYRRLSPNFAQTAKALTRLTLIIKAEWKPKCQSVFDELKNKLGATPALAYSDFQLPIILATDASKIAIAAAVLLQVKGGVERLISFSSRRLNKAERAYSASEL
jgi:hypothetical protein